MQENGAEKKGRDSRENTKEKLLRVFGELLRERPMEKITVREVVERSGVSRKTFYYHFDDIFQMGETLLDRKLARLLQESVRMESPREVLGLFFTYLMEGEQIMRNSMEVDRYAARMRLAQNKICDYFYHFLDEKGKLADMTREEADMTARLLAYFIMGLGMEKQFRSREEIDRTLDMFERVTSRWRMVVRPEDGGLFPPENR